MTRRRARGLRLLTGTVALLLTVAPLTIGGAQAQTSSEPAEKITLTVGIPGDMVSPNPFKACCSYEYEMMFLAYDMLFNFGAQDLTPVPGLAESCEPSADNMTWTCKIRSGVTWSDGEPLTSEDIAFTYRFILDNGISTFSDYLPFNPTFETPDETTLIWKSEKPTIAPTVPPWIPIVPQHIWEQYDGTDFKTIKAVDVLADGPAVSSGPYILTEWEAGQFFKMEANKEHWLGESTIDEIVYQIFDNREAMVQALKSGEIDFADDLNPTLFNSLEGEPNIGTVRAAPSSFTNFAFNFGSPPDVAAWQQMANDTHHPAIDDLAFRQAIAHATDKQAVVDSIYQGNAIPGSSITLPSRIWHYEPPAEDVFDFNLDTANQILDDAGYEDTDGDGVREMPGGGEPLELDVLTINSSTGSNDTGLLMAGWAEQIGVKFNVIPVSEGKAYVLWEEGDFDAYIWGWGGDPDPDFILSIFTTAQCLSWSDGCYSDPAFDEMYLEQRSIFDTEERRTFVNDMQAFLYEQVPEIVVAYPNYLQAYRTDAFEGYVPMPADGGAYLFGWGPDSYLNLTPVSAEAGGSGGSTNDGGSNAILYVGLAAVAIAVGAFVVTRRRRADEDRG
jgi:peptide/nickel transport system substrate-binding protein